MANNYTTVSKKGIEYLCGLINQLANVSEGIDDLNLRTDGTFSSVKIDTLLNTLKTDCNDYTDRLVANLSRLELKIATSESEITQPNTMYLYKPSGSSSYEQYVVIEGAKVLLGTTDINMGDYYTISQTDAKFVLKTDFDSLKTEVDEKVNKTDIVDNLTSTDTDKPLSANQGKVLKDEVDLKANDSEVVKKTDIVTTIDKTSTNDKIPTAKAIYNNPKNKIPVISNGTDIFAYADSIEEYVTITVKLMNGVNSPYGANVNNDFYYTIINMPSVNYKRIVAYDIRKNVIYMNIKHVDWGTWQRVCTTSIADVPKTNITFDNTTNYSVVGNESQYFIKNGICTMVLHVKCNIPVGWVTVANIPKARDLHCYQQLSNLDGTGFMRCSIRTNGKLELSRGAAGTEYIGTFSYPVAES